MAFCLTKEGSDKFKQALRDGTINPGKLAGMTSSQRSKFLSNIVGVDNAKQVNALFESKLLLKNQQRGMITWAKKVAGITPNVRRDLISRIERLDKVLDPKEEQQFLQDLASTRLNIDVTQEEAKTIIDLSKKLSTLKEKANADGIFPTPADKNKYGMARVNIENFIADLKLQSKSIKFREEKIKKITSLVGQAPGAMKSVVASLDNSFWGRQGIKSLLDVRTSGIWFKNFLKSFGDIGRQLTAEGKWYRTGESAVLDSIKADIYSRPNALNGKYQAGGYGLNVLSEEEFPSSLPENIPLLGRLFKASEAAYNGGALRLRADLADRLIATAERQGVDTLNKVEAQGMGELISSLTGRGSLGRLEPLSKEVNILLFSAKFLKGNFDTLTAHRFNRRATPFARKESAKNLLSMVTSIASILTIANLIDPDSVEADPRSTNFGKVKVFGHWTDVTGGMASMVTLASRTMIPTKREGVWGLWNKSSTGKWTNLTEGGFGARTALDVFENFWEGKLSPAAGILRDVWRGRNFQGEKPNLENILKNSLTPISIQNFNELRDDPETSSVLGSMILELGGLSVSTYKFKDNWETKTSQELKQFREKVGDAEFKIANEDFNRAYNDWFNTVQQLPEYKDLSGEDKGKLITKSKSEIKKQIFKEYRFKPKRKKKTTKEKSEEKKRNKLLP